MNKNHIHKSYKLKASSWFIGLLLPLASCKLTEVNVNPNASNTAPNSVLLTGAEAALGFSFGADVNPFTSIVAQQFAGSNGDASQIQSYAAGPGSYDQLWNDVNTAGLKNLAIIIKNAEGNSPYYAGISRILLAHGVGSLTDLFGDIPYTQAYKGETIQNPKYDSQESIYADLQVQLDKAIAELSLPASANTGAVPSTDDLIFAGNTNKWIATAWTLKARFAIHLTKINATEAATKALEYTAKGISSNANDFQLNFGSSPANSNPYFQFQNNRVGWVSVGGPFVNLLNGNEVTDNNLKAATLPIDPRRAYFAAPTTPGSNAFIGFQLGSNSPSGLSYLGPYLKTATAPVIFATYSENKFIEAEARLILNAADPLAKTALDAGINASFNKAITSATDTNATAAKREAYIANKATLTGDFQKDLEKIITQKYIALYTLGEVWVDYRRTGYPKLPTVQGTTGIPRRFPYPSNENLLNTANIPDRASTYYTPRLWWDKE